MQGVMSAKILDGVLKPAEGGQDPFYPPLADKGSIARLRFKFRH